MMQVMKKRIRYGKMIMAAAAVAVAAGLFADDAAGVFKVDVRSNETVMVAIPFHPLSTNGMQDVLFGDFLRDEAADELTYLDSRSGGMRDLAFSESGWAGVDDGLPFASQVRLGDAFAFSSSDALPFSFYVLGRVPFEAEYERILFPGVNDVSDAYPCSFAGNGGSWMTPREVTNSSGAVSLMTRYRPYPALAFGSPVIVDMDVDPADGTVGLEMVSEGNGVDVFELASDGGYAAVGWRHAARYPAFSGSSDYLDEGRFGDSDGPRSMFYLVSNSDVDTDGDGLSDALEEHVYGTSALLADTDGDGRSDIIEIAAGTDPLCADGEDIGFFTEGFEPPAVLPGGIDGQNGWRSSSPEPAVVALSSAYSGLAGLSARVPGGDSPGDVSHEVRSSGDVVWIDMRQTVSCDCEGIGLPGNALAAFGFDAGGHPYAINGGVTTTNLLMVLNDDAWVRSTVKLDFSNGAWDLFLDGRRAFEGLGFGSSASGMASLGFRGYWGDFDDIAVTSSCPSGLSLDGDGMPDEWELARFGDLSRSGEGDADGDGVSDAAEYAAGSDPLVRDAIPGPEPTGPDADSLRPGLLAEFRRFGEAAYDMPEFGACEPFAVSVSPIVDHPSVRWIASGDAIGDFFACEMSGYLLAPADAVYNFYLTSDDGAELVIDGETVISDTLPHSRRTASGAKRLGEGYHEIVVRYYDDAGDELLRLEWYVVGGVERGIVPATALFHRSKDFPPLLSFAADEPEYYEGGDAVLLARAYDLDGRIRSLAIYDGRGEMLGSSDSEELRCVIDDVGVGTNMLFAVASDDGGNSVTSSVGIVVSEAPSGYVQKIVETLVQGDAAVSNQVGRVSHPLAGEAWEGSPFEDSYSAVYEGFLFVPESGEFTVALASDDGSRLYIDGVPVIDGYYAHQYMTLSAKVRLRSAMHELRIEYFEDAGQAGVDFMWDYDGTMRTVPPQHLFRSSGRGDDGDGDGMPDWWEIKNRLDPTDPADATLDSDGDTLTNLAEFLAGSDPYSGDGDGDGMPDEWEVSNGTCPFVDDALDDPDGDGLINIDEYLAGTRPDLADTDGDGASDYLELRDTRGDPLVDDIAWGYPIEAGGFAAGSAFVASTGTWRIDGQAAFAAERAGSLTWHLSVPAGGADALAVRIGQRNVFAMRFSFDISLYVDGLFVARQIAEVSMGETSDVYFFLPEIPSGEHDFRLAWHNWDVNTFLAVHDLRFVSFGGPDLDGDGVPDWKNHRASICSALDALPLESIVSPLCVEGHDLWRDILEIDVAYPGTNAVFSTVKTVGDGFYADIPLPEEGSAAVSLRDRSLCESFSVTWKALDVFSGDYSTSPLVIREGDSLKFAPYAGTEESEFLVERADFGAWMSVTNWTSSSVSPYLFAENGFYLVTVTHRGFLFDDTAYVPVEVVRSVFPGRNPAILRDAEQKLSCPQLSPRNVIEHDTALAVGAVTNSAGGIDLSLFTREDRELGLVSRLEDDGAISDAVQITPVWADNGTYYRVADTYPDGSQIISVSLLLGAVPAGTSVTLEIFVAGVTFEDGTRLKTLLPGDFDADGHCTVRFVRARGVTTSVCHHTYIYQDGKLIYSN